MKEGKLYVISGPSGVGKGTIVSHIMEIHDAALSVSMTTRKPRPVETEGVSYYFVSHEKFEEMIDNDGLLEYAEVFDNYYGTPAAPVLEKLKAGQDVILEIDVQGAMQVRSRFPASILIFILPKNIAGLSERIESRGTETKEHIEKRLKKAMAEIEYIENYDYYVINDLLEPAVAEVSAIMTAESLKVNNNTREKMLIKMMEE